MHRHYLGHKRRPGKGGDSPMATALGSSRLRLTGLFMVLVLGRRVEGGAAKTRAGL